MTEHVFPPYSAESRYRALLSARQYYLEAAKECCKYTVPAMLSFFEDGVKSWADVRTPYQGIGARGLNNLASKLLTAITPVNIPMFRLVAEDSTEDDYSAEIEEQLNKYTETVTNCIKASGDYAHMFEVWQLLLVSGNVLIADPDDNGNIRVYSLRDYVLKRDRSGNVTEIIIKESVSPEALPAETVKAINTSDYFLPSEKMSMPDWELYTYAARKGDFFYVHQECKGTVISGTEGKYPLEGCPFIPIRMYAGAGEDYSRSFVSGYLGDLKSVDGLSQGAVEGAAMAAKHIYLVHPDGLTDIKDIEETPNGGIVYGRLDDVQVLQSNKGGDLRVASDEAAKIERRLSQAFLLLDGGIRNAERVTREEIRAIAGELESALGGVYSVMCHSFQMPYIKRKIWKLQRLMQIRPLNKSIKPVVVTGFEALGIIGDKERLLEFITVAAKVLGDSVQDYINTDVFITRLASGFGVKTAGLIKTREALKASS